jgi:hypothetical protein
MSAESSSSGRDAKNDPPATDGDAGFDEAALYRTVRTAVEDAILDAVGTVLLVLVGTVIAIAGGRLVVSGAFGSTVALAPVAAGVWIVAIGVYIVTSSLGLVAPIREWV